MPGRQTVPRAELQGCILYLDYLIGIKNLLDEATRNCITARPVNIDASYVVEGVKKGDIDSLIDGMNGDVWAILFEKIHLCN